MDILKKCLIILIFLICVLNNVYANDDEKDELKNSIELDSLVDTLEQYTGNTGLGVIKDDLLSGKGLDYGVIGNSLVGSLTKEIYPMVKGAIGIIVVIILMSILTALELEEENKISKVAYLISFLTIISICINTYLNILNILTDSINITTKIVQAVSPFIMALLMATGAIVSTGIIQPIFLFLIGSVGIVINYIVVPLITTALVLSIISGMSDILKFGRLSTLLSKSSIWIITVLFALFIGVLSLETNIGASIDAVTVKTTQAAVSNVIPVIGKFVSDSTEIVFGSAKIIGNVSGTIGIVALILGMLVPIIKIIIVITIYVFLSAFAEAISAEKKIIHLMESLSTIYKTLLGILVGVMCMFVICIGVIMSLMQKVTG